MVTDDGENFGNGHNHFVDIIGTTTCSWYLECSCSQSEWKMSRVYDHDYGTAANGTECMGRTHPFDYMLIKSHYYISSSSSSSSTLNQTPSWQVLGANSLSLANSTSDVATLYAMHSHAPRDIEVQIHPGGRSALQLAVVGTQERMQSAQRTVGLFHCTEVWAKEGLKSWLWETEQSGTQAFGNAVEVTLSVAWGQNWEEKPVTGLPVFPCLTVASQSGLGSAEASCASSNSSRNWLGAPVHDG